MSNGTEIATVNRQVAIAAGSRGLELRNLDELWRFATIAAKSGLAPRDLNTTEKVFIALQWGAEIGVSPMQALKNIAVINGRACMWGELLTAIVRRSPLCKGIKSRYEGQGESRVCIVVGRRQTGDEIEESEGRFGYADAKRASLIGKDTYKSYPDRMYLARARAFVLKDLFADLLCGLDVAEEAQDIDPERAVEANIVSGDDAPGDELDAVAETLPPAEDELQGPSVLEEPNYAEGEASPEELRKLAEKDGVLF